jgi:hypothetical protein
MPVRHRYRSPIFIEFYPAGNRHADAYASLWLLELVDGEEKDFSVPIFKCDNSLRLSQNYITQDNYREIPDTKIEEVGRVHFRGRFSAGTDSDHVKFVSDNDSRETIETWEACYAEGVRQEEVRTEVPPLVQKLHDQSLTHGRDVLAQADEKEKDRWMAKDGTDWSGAFGQDPKQLMARRDSLKKDSEEYDDFDEEGDHRDDDDDGDDDDDDDDDSPDLGIQDAVSEPSHPSEGSDAGRRSFDTQATNGTGSSQSGSKNPFKAYKNYQGHSRDLHRKHRGLMQWRPMRNVQFAKDEAKYAVRKVTKLGALDGREPDVETEV